MASTRNADDYELLTQRDHALKNSDMYIGDVNDHTPRTVCVYDGEKINRVQATHPRALDQLFIEVLGNAADNVWDSRDRGIEPRFIQVQFDDSSCTVKNYGLGIPIESQNGMWVPEKIFSQFLSGSNFSKKKGRYSIGKNGVGAKATNVFSRKFVVKCGDADRKLQYEQTFRDNMGSKSEPIISPYDGENFVEIYFAPDFEKFGETGYTETNLGITIYYSISISFTYDIPVYVNGTKYHVSSIEAYARLHFSNLKASNFISYKTENNESEVFIADTPMAGIVSPFVNGIPTPEGGVHVDAIYGNLIPQIVEILGKGAEGVKVNKKHVESHVSIFLNCRLKDPKFGGQTKEKLTSPTPKIELPAEQLKKIRKWSLLEYVHHAIKATQFNKIKKSETGRKSKVKDKNLVPANWAGKKGLKDKTTLVAIEGESASGYFNTFLSLVPDDQGHDLWGLQMLHGKLINTLTADFQQLMENQDIDLMKKALDLKEGVDYNIMSNIAKLHYGRVMIATDADNDGIHILCLLIVFFAFKFPGLLKNGFIHFYRTPIYRLRKGGKTICFYTETSFDKYCSTNDTKGWDIKRYKGLATSMPDEIKQDYEAKKIVKLILDEKALDNLRINFTKERADERKAILLEWMDSNVPDLEPYTELDVSDVLRYEFPLYIREAILRHIPHYLDGLKDSQRKALFGLFNLLKGKKEIKVEHLASETSKITAYTHGETSMSKAIIHMAQDYFCTNNLPWFTPRGAFGSREMGNREAGAPRYTYVSMPPWLSLMYRKEDTPLLERIRDVDAEEYEVKQYYPILSTLAINGVDGIGSGWSTSVPKHNPLDVALWLKERINQRPVPFIGPWYRKFKGTFKIKGKDITSYGIYQNNINEIVVTELPVGRCNKAYDEKLDQMEEEKIIEDHQSKSSTDKALFFIQGYKSAEPPSHKTLHLITSFSYKNMNVIIPTGKNTFTVRKYDSIQDLLEHFYQERLVVYQKRKEYHLQRITNEIEDIIERIRFIQSVNNGELIILRRPRAEIYADMNVLKFNNELLKKVTSAEYSDEGIVHHQQEIEKLRQQHAELLATTIEQLWERDIDELVDYLIKKEKFSPRTLEDCENDQKSMVKE